MLSQRQVPAVGLDRWDEGRLFRALYTGAPTCVHRQRHVSSHPVHIDRDMFVTQVSKPPPPPPPPPHTTPPSPRPSAGTHVMSSRWVDSW